MSGAGDFDAFVRARWEPLVRAALLLTGDRASAEDLAQETLVRVAQRWDRIDGSPEGYARRVMYTRSVDAWRWRRRQPDPVETTDRSAGFTPDPSGSVVARLTLAEALRRLTARQRAVLVLRFYEDRTEVDTAAVLGCSVSTVKSQTRHALARLRVLAPELADTFDAEVLS